MKYYKRGSIFFVDNLYRVLAYIDDNKWSLVDLKDGNRWEDPYECKSSHINKDGLVCISHTNLKKLIGQDLDFKYLGNHSDLFTFNVKEKPVKKAKVKHIHSNIINLRRK